MKSGVLCGDNLTLLRALPSKSVHLIYLDPPYFTQREWRIGEHVFDDRFDSRAAYIEWMRPRAVEMFRALKKTGSLYCQCDYHADAYLALLFSEIFGPDKLRNSVVWKRRMGACNDSKGFGHSFDTIYFFTRGARWTWNFPSDTAGQPLTNFWDDIPPPGRKERQGYPTQKPLALLRRIIEASSRPGDIVLDPFCGSGTTLVAAAQCGRKYIGIDQSETACALAECRLREETGRC